ncbi:MAG: hypothetical protein OEW23_17690, partial [Candidatus Aminicenantes bacterium]|nr:hypothetical protein [Candidatus Aminicenantes bacterium]
MYRLSGFFSNTSRRDITFSVFSVYSFSHPNEAGDPKALTSVMPFLPVSTWLGFVGYIHTTATPERLSDLFRATCGASRC